MTTGRKRRTGATHAGRGERPVPRPVAATGRAEWGSDVVVDLLRACGIDYIAVNPGATFRGLHDSLVNYGGNRAPEIILCTHEEIAVGIAHGYARAKGKPMAAAVHNIVGLQHASMAIYNAWADRLPIIVVGGTGPMDATDRRPWIDWVHTALVQGSIVRDYVKWDDQPATVEAVPESFMRAYRLATTDPMGPVYLCYDAGLQETRLAAPLPVAVDRYPAPLPIQAPEEGFATTIRWLLEARTPVIVADTVGRREAGFRALGELAELLAIPVLDQLGRLNFPVRHPLNLTGLHQRVIPAADLVLALDVPDFEGAVSVRNQERGQRRAKPLLSPGTRIVNVGLDDLLVRGWSADSNRLRQADLMIMADTAVFLPELVKRLRASSALRGLGARIAGRRTSWTTVRAEKAAAHDRDRRAEWNATPISMGRLCGDLETVLEGERWMLASGSSQGKENHYLPAAGFNQILGRYQGAGVGYGLPASIGAALALKGTGAVCVDLQPDGCLLYTAGGLWTAVHHAIPLLIVVCNNRSYYNDEEHQERVAHARGRPVENKRIGISLDDPAVDFAALARSYGCWARGPIADPRNLLATLREAMKVVKAGSPALVDVVCQMR